MEKKLFLILDEVSNIPKRVWRKTSLSKKKMESFLDEMANGLEEPYCARFAQHFSPVNYGAPCRYCGKSPNK